MVAYGEFMVVDGDFIVVDSGLLVVDGGFFIVFSRKPCRKNHSEGLSGQNSVSSR